MLSWYVMRSKQQKEEWLYNQLRALSLEAYYPCLRVSHGKLHSHKSKPYFPGYLFVNIDLDLAGISALQWIPGSLGLVSFGGEPAYVTDGLLQKIRNRVAEMNGAQDNMLESLKSGDRVMIHSGPFAGREAIFCDRLRDSERVQLLLKMLQDQTIRVNLSSREIRITRQNSSPDNLRTNMK
ncbi:MAG: transcription termination/antitermination NusG family protein [Chloroflexota bacterium]